MRNRDVLSQSLVLTALTGGLLTTGLARGAQERVAPPRDAIAEAQAARPVPTDRTEQQRTEHDRSGVFAADKARASSPAFEDQPEKGRIEGFDFYRDPLNAKKPKETFERI